jgi:3'(2'), 5'-bisphosphate nucleotidase
MLARSHPDEDLLNDLLGIAWEAGRIVQDCYRRGVSVAYKGPNDPVTQADLLSNALICERLGARYPGVPIVAEESAADTYRGYQTAERIFFVDPLDGTQEFIARNGEFVVMIGVVDGERATVGVITAPDRDRTWIGSTQLGAFEVASDGSRKKLQPSQTPECARASLVVSRSHQTAANQQLLESLGSAEIVKLGSAGLKGCAVAAGEADIYVGPKGAGLRWDACAIDAIVCASGGQFSDLSGQRLDYRAANLKNDGGLLATNGRLHDSVISHLAQRHV